MDFESAAQTVETLGLAMLTAPSTNIGCIAVGNLDGGSVVGAKEYRIDAFVPKKLSQEELEESNIQSFEAFFAQSVGESPPPSPEINVVEVGGDFQPLIGLGVPAPLRGLHGGNPPALNAQKWFSSLRSGIGITNPKGAYPNFLSVGTLGFFLRSDAGDTYLVSNNHVIGRVNDAISGEPVVQPGTLDLTGAELQAMPKLNALVRSLKIGEVHALVPIQFITPLNTPHNTVDAAMATLDTNSGRSLANLGRLTFGGGVAGVANPFQPDPVTGDIQGSELVYKVGRTTGYTEGIVTGILGVATIPYAPNKKAYFTGQILVDATPDNVGPFSDRGDSGSAVLNMRNEIVGLLFAGTPNRTLVNPIEDVLDQLRQKSGDASLAVATL